jgi:HK97 gp10 family phage protein
MSKGFEIEIKGLNELMAMAEKYPKVSEKHINKAISLSLNRIRNDAVNDSPVHKGGIKKSWRIQMKRFEGKLSNIMTAKDGTPYPYDVEFGRGPHYVSPKELEPWAKSKGLNPYAVSKSIFKKGTKGQHFFKKALDKNRDTFQPYFDEAITNIMKEI